MAHQPEVGVDLVVAQGLSGLRGLQLGGQLQVGTLPAQSVLDDLPGAAGAGTGVADVHPLALQVENGLDAGIVAGNDGDGLRWMENTARSSLNGPLSLNLEVPL